MKSMKQKSLKKVLSLAVLAGFGAVSLAAADAAAGGAAYEKSCKGCHGADGTPNPAMVNMMKVQIPDLKSAEVQALSDDDIKGLITNGKGKMRPVKTVSGPALDDVIAFVHSLKK